MTQVRRQHFSLPLSDFIPVDRREELVGFHLFCVTRGPESLLGVPVQEEQDDLAGVVRHRVRDFQWSMLDIVKQLRLGSVEVGRNTDEHLVDEDS